MMPHSANTFRAAVAYQYRETRFLPTHVARQCFSAAAQRLALNPAETLSILDIGCGVGRLADHLATGNTVFRYTGVDRSVDMLRQFAGRVNGDRRFRLIEGDAAELTQNETAHITLFHWIANTDARWPSILRRACNATKIGGGIFWMEERSTLYDVIDGVLPPDLPNFASDALTRFFDDITGPSDSGRMQIRRGLPLRDNGVATLLRSRGFSVSLLPETSFQWQKTIDMQWLLRSVFAPRAFSNFELFPARVYARALRRLRQSITQYRRDSRVPLRLRFSTVPVLARRAA